MCDRFTTSALYKYFKNILKTGNKARDVQKYTFDQVNIIEYDFSFYIYTLRSVDMILLRKIQIVTNDLFSAHILWKQYRNSYFMCYITLEFMEEILEKDKF